MKILTQDRKAVIDLPKEVWAAEFGQAAAVVCADREPLGIYSDYDRAKAVLREIFDYYRNGKKTYVMPE